MKKKLLLLVLLSALILPNAVSAAMETIKFVVANIVSAVTIVATALIIIFFIITGLLFLTAQGDPTKLSTAKKALYMAIAGTALVILAQVAGTIIGNALLSGV